MDSRWLGVIVLVIIVALGGWYVFSHPMQGTAPAATDMATTTDTASSTAAAPMDMSLVTVTYDGSSFSPASVTVMQGQTVTFVNQSSEQMWVASDPHPTHTGYDGTSRTTHCAAGYAGATPFDECAAAGNGGSYSFVFTKAGSFGYHNHANDSVHGTVIVTPAMPATGESASTTINVQVQ